MESRRHGVCEGIVLDITQGEYSSHRERRIRWGLPIEVEGDYGWGIKGVHEPLGENCATKFMELRN